MDKKKGEQVKRLILIFRLPIYPTPKKSFIF